MPTAKKATKKRAKKFEDRTKTEQRVVLAKDALSLLRKKRLTVQPGIYLEVDRPKNLYHSTRTLQLWDRLLKAEFSVAKPNCSVCALGSLLVAEVDRTDNCMVGDINHASHYFTGERLENYFTRNQLRLLEGCFEGRGCGGSRTTRVMSQYHARHMDPTMRLRKILRNVIRNNGMFRPSQDL